MSIGLGVVVVVCFLLVVGLAAVFVGGAATDAPDWDDEGHTR